MIGNPGRQRACRGAPEQVICAAFSSVIWPADFTVMPKVVRYPSTFLYTDPHEHSLYVLMLAAPNQRL
jgi:hypothetical protein